MKPKQKPTANRNRQFLLMTSIFSVLLLLISCIACYYAYIEKKTQILTSMDMAYSRMEQEYENILTNFWQAYMPIYDNRSSDYAAFLQYFASSDSEELTTLQKQALSKALEQMISRDNRIEWLALFSEHRAVNYIKFNSDSTLRAVDDTFPYLADVNAKSSQMEVYGARDIGTTFGTARTFAIGGGVPAGMGKGTILIGYRLNTFEEISNFRLDSVPSIRYFIWSNNQLLFDSLGTYRPAEIYPPSGEQRGIFASGGSKLYVRAGYTGNNTTIVAYSASWGDIFKAAHQDTLWILSITLAFIFLSLLVNTSMSRSVFKEVSVIRRGLNVLADNNLDYRLPTRFKQSGLPEIARYINEMSSRLNDNIKKAYSFELKQKDAQLAELQATFNPHFLYNTLEMLRSKSYSNGDEDTAALISDLAMIFRSLIGAKNVVTLKEELAFSQKYLALLIARYGDKVTVLYDVESSLLNYGVIRNLFQILIENYFVHGFNASGRDNRIRLVGKSLDDRNMLLLMEDNGFGMSEGEIQALNQQLNNPIRQINESYGLKNLHQRLKLFYGPDYGLHIQRNGFGGLTVQMKLQKMRVEDYDHTNQAPLP